MIKTDAVIIGAGPTGLFTAHQLKLNDNHFVLYEADYTEKEEIIAKFDRTQLIRVVTNLVKNAIQATQDVENPQIRVEVKNDKERVCILVIDNGMGISDENAPLIFQPKFTTKTSGMGLGLAMVKSIVESCDGSVTFTSRTGTGTVFKVSLPLAD